MFSISLEISDEGKERLSTIAAFEGTNFTKLVELSLLSKTSDFIEADLSHVDFSNSDLRGFNFTGANLAGCYGINVRLDETTVLTDANVAGSILAVEKEKREYFSMHEDHYSLYKRLQKEYWTTGALWVGENLRKNSKNFEASARIAKYLYASVKDQTYKNQILYGIMGTFKSSEEYKEFLLIQLSDRSLTRRSLRGVLDILGSVFAADPIVKKMLLLYLGHSDKEIRKLCIPPVMVKPFFIENREAILRSVYTETDPSLRMLYTQLFAQKVGPTALRLLYRNDKKSFQDYAEHIDDRVFEKLIRGAVKAMKIERKASQIQRAGAIVSLGTDVSEREFIESIDYFEPTLRRVADLGLPLQLDYSVATFKAILRKLPPFQTGPSFTDT
ncbi:pentapeptide repeat-containing protein [Rhizobium sp. BK602]|uniref:pentapeptide repeat-containing protein n=1 Tax=Rhizobium sp. BK602 TaxID=2586986 RepID=UPI00160CD14C|nr:pentapeptide repeat-containing protein [Rhizobium sp. BK602]MBB3612091.1 hypothetical protein [Rhizobium sp. BK602]